MTHAELIRAVGVWLRSKRFRVVLEDVQATCVNELPDVIAWKGNGSSVLVEAKVSRADFARDRLKWHRREPQQGMGYHRYYAVPEKGPMVIDPAAVWETQGWGLLLVSGNGRVKVAKKSGPFTKRNEQAERALLVSAVCRVTDGWGRKIFGPDAPLNPDGDPPLSTAKVIRELRRQLYDQVKEATELRKILRNAGVLTGDAL